MNWFLLAFTSAAFSAAAAISQKKILFKIEALEFSYLLSIIILIFSIPFFFTVNYSETALINLLILYLKTIPGTLAFLFVMLSIKNLEISKALPLLALTPGLVAVFAFILIGDNLSFIEILGMVLLLAGTYLLETKPGQKIFDPFKVFVKSDKHHYVVYALLLFTATSIVDRWLLGRYKLTPGTFMGFQQLFFAVNFVIILFLLNKKPAEIIKSVSNDVWKWIILIAFLTVAYRFMEILAVKAAPVALVLSIKRISIFFAVLIGGRIFKEKNLALKATAAAVIISGAILIAQ